MISFTWTFIASGWASPFVLQTPPHEGSTATKLVWNRRIGRNRQMCWLIRSSRSHIDCFRCHENRETIRLLRLIMCWQSHSRYWYLCILLGDLKILEIRTLQKWYLGLASDEIWFGTTTASFRPFLVFHLPPLRKVWVLVADGSVSDSSCCWNWLVGAEAWSLDLSVCQRGSQYSPSWVSNLGAGIVDQVDHHEPEPVKTLKTLDHANWTEDRSYRNWNCLRSNCLWFISRFDFRNFFNRSSKETLQVAGSGKDLGFATAMRKSKKDLQVQMRMKATKRNHRNVRDSLSPYGIWKDVCSFTIPVITAYHRRLSLSSWPAQQTTAQRSKCNRINNNSWSNWLSLLSFILCPSLPLTITLLP